MFSVDTQGGIDLGVSDRSDTLLREKLGHYINFKYVWEMERFMEME